MDRMLLEIRNARPAVGQERVYYAGLKDMSGAGLRRRMECRFFSAPLGCARENRAGNAHRLAGNCVTD